MTIENASTEKCWDYFNPLKSEEEIPGSWVACIYTSKISHVFKKQKKSNTEIICAKIITGVNVVTLQFFYINTCCLDFTVFLFVVFLSEIKKSLNICATFH